MLTAAQSVFARSRLQQRSTRSRILVDQLLLVLSDGRGVFADGVNVSQSGIYAVCSGCLHVCWLQPMEIAVRRLNEMGVFCVFVILDSLSKVCL